MPTEGIEAVFLTTHNWGKTAKFFQGLGFELEFATDHESGQLRNGDGPYVFVAEVPETVVGRRSREPRAESTLTAPSISGSRSASESTTSTDTTSTSGRSIRGAPGCRAAATIR
jgi:hypothetical protein